MKNETKTDDEKVAQIVNRVMGRLMPVTAEQSEKIKADDIEARRRAIIALRSEWNAPKRHALLDVPQKAETKWGVKLNLLESMAGTGYLAALVGIRGNGKTQMGVELMRHATRNLRSAFYVTAMDFFEDVKATYGICKSTLENQRSVIKRFRRPALLIIDEIGKRSDSEWENNLLFAVVNHRYNDLTDTVLIDNRTRSEFIASIGPSLASRISETGGIIECDWPSFRK